MYDHIASDGKGVGLVSQLKGQIASHYHSELIMSVPVLIKMRACWKDRVVSVPACVRIGTLARSSYSNRKAISTTGRPPQHIRQIIS